MYQVKILDIKVDYSHAQSKCNSKANLKHKPGKLASDKSSVDWFLHLIMLFYPPLKAVEMSKSSIGSWTSMQIVNPV